MNRVNFIFSLLFLLVTQFQVSKGQTYDLDLIFGDPGVNGTAFCAASQGSDVYIGGSFTKAGSLKANNIAKWNGIKWDTLGNGVTGVVYAMLIKGDELYVGGTFTIAGLPDVYCLAKWNITSQTWHPIGTKSSIGANYYAGIHTMAIDGDYIYMGGRFNSVGDIQQLGSIIKYNTTNDTWENIGKFSNVTLPAGWECNVNDIVVKDGKVYIGGDFTHVTYPNATGHAVNTVVEYDGTTFTNVGSNNILPETKSIAFDGDQIYASGNFSYTGFKHVAMLSAGAWVSLSNQFPSGINAVNSIVVHNGEVYAAGGTASSAWETNNVSIKWNGTEWSTVGSEGIKETSKPGEAHYINKLYKTGNDQIFALGNFKTADGYKVNNVAYFDGFQWRMAGHYLNGDVRVLKKKGNDLYAGGSFRTAGSDTVNFIARWDGYKWNKVGTGLNFGITAIAFMDDSIFVGGSQGVSYYNGTSWKNLGGGDVNDIEIAGNKVYAGGELYINVKERDIAENIAMWDGSWHSFGKLPNNSFSGVNDRVYDLEIGPDGLLYLAGVFSEGNGVAIDGVAAWDGKKFISLNTNMGAGSGNPVYMLKTFGDKLFIGGSFAQVGGVANTNNIAYWDGSSWNSVGGANERVLSMESDGTSLYVSGSFTSINGMNISYLAEYDGTNWKKVIPSNWDTKLLDGYYGDLGHDIAVGCDQIFIPGEYNHASKMQYSIIQINKSACTQSIELISPGISANWAKNSLQSISWNFSGVSTIKIEYSTDGGSSWNLIKSGVSASNENYEWKVPDIVTANMVIKISSEQSPFIYDQSSAFSINSNPSLTLLSPYGGTEVYYACDMDIKWTSINIDNILIEYSDDDAPWMPIATVPAASGTYNWKIPGNATYNSRIRISDASNVAIKDSTPFDFDRFQSTECPVLIMNFSNMENTVFTVGSIQTISWYAQNIDVTNARLEFSSDNGATWAEIASDVSMSFNYGSYNWTVPNTPSANCYIRVTNLEDEGMTDINNFAFTIAGPNSLTILTSFDGATFTAGTTQTVSWDFTGTDESVILALSYNGSNLMLLGFTTASAESYQFTVPARLADDCKVVILYSSTGMIADESDGYFSITEGSGAAASIESPSHNQQVPAGSFVNITWNVANVNNVTLEYSTDYGSTWTVIASNLPANNARIAATVSGEYTWQIPNLGAGQMLMIRLKNTADNSLLDQLTLQITITTEALYTAGNPEELLLFPNPVIEKLHIEISGDADKIEIYNYAGVKVYEAMESAQPVMVDRLTKGLYVMKVYSKEQKVYTRTFIKE